MIGLVLAAGAGRRLRPYTDDLPKALVPLREDGTSVLDETLANFAAVGLGRVAIVVGYRAEAIVQRIDGWEETHDLTVDLVYNDRAEDCNNAYSLWCARDVITGGAILANGDTLHPSSITASMISLTDSDITLAVDTEKRLGAEEMKVLLDPDGSVCRISKQLPHDANGEYIGVARIPASQAVALATALEQTWQDDKDAFYEAAFQRLADAGTRVATQPIGNASWIEIDDMRDLARAQEMLCRS